MHRVVPMTALALLLAGCLQAPGQPLQAEETPMPAVEPPEALAFTNLTGTLLALPVLGGEQRFTYIVPEGSAWVAAVLKWQTRRAVLTLTALDPEGQERGETRPLADPGARGAVRLDWWSPEALPGTWTLVVRGTAALQEPVFLQLHTARQVDGMHVAEALRVPEGRFAEVNMLMEAGDTVRYAWGAAEPLYFNIHTHRNGETINLVEDTTSTMETSFTAEEEGGYSLLWAFGEGVGPVAPPGQGGRSVELWYRVDGAFELHSAVG